jgi:hypothetical protein
MPRVRGVPLGLADAFGSWQRVVPRVGGLSYELERRHGGYRVVAKYLASTDFPLSPGARYVPANVLEMILRGSVDSIYLVTNGRYEGA